MVRPSDFASLSREVHAFDLLRRPGQLYVYESEESFQKDQMALDVRRRHNVKMEILDGQAARAQA